MQEVLRGNMENLLLKIAPKEVIDKKLEHVFETLFGQESPERIYFEEDDMAYIVDTGNDDVRTEGMSYGMMIALQLDKPKMFSQLWKWVKTYMTVPEGHENEGYFIWSCAPNGQANSDGPAPDGEEYFAAALLLAEKRWEIKEYGDEARALLHAMVHKGENNDGYPMFEPENTYIKFVAHLHMTDPSYHLPHFYQLYAKYGNPEDSAFFLKSEEEARKFWLKSANAKTGLTPEYADYEGKPYDIDGHWTFFSDAYRTVANIGLDWLWEHEEIGQSQIALNIQKFFEPYLENDEEILVFKIDGQPLRKEEQTAEGFPPLKVHHPIGLWSTLAQASLVTNEFDSTLALKYLKYFWNLKLRRGKYRYYDNLLYLFALLALSRNYQKEWS